MWDNRKAYTFIILMGLVSLLSDITYESARGLSGPYLALLGASALVVSVVSGIGELLGYTLRLISGYLSDRLRSYWAFTFLGYALSLLSVPALALVNTWQWASFLLFLERIGKAVRTPAKDVLLSNATQRVGHGKGFGLHEFLDQIGAIAGPVFVSLILYSFGSYKMAFTLLLIPALLALISLICAKSFYTNNVEQHQSFVEKKSISKGVAWYLFATFILGLSFLQFPVLAYHQIKGGLEGYAVTFFYAFAMLIDALSAVAFGFLFDRKGPIVLPLGIAVTSLYPLLVFNKDWIFLGIALWGALLGIQESILRSWIAQNVPLQSRATAYGLFYFALGISSLIGGFFVGYIYSLGIPYLMTYSLGLGLLSSIVFFIAIRRHSA